MQIDLTELRGYISDMYGDLAMLPRGDYHFPTGLPLLQGLGYDADLLDRIPAGAVESTASVGFHFGLEPLRQGERVLDIGCGAGCDCFYSALQVGETGHVIGVDMTDGMHEKSKKNLAEFELDNVEFLQGFAEELPVPDASVDVVISNGVINLTPTKDVVFREIARVLVPGGRAMFSDFVTGVDLPQSVRENCTLWAECIGGAMERQRYLRQLEAAGLKIEQILDNEYTFSQDSTERVARKFQVQSISVLARKA